LIKKQQLADQVIEYFSAAIASGGYAIGAKLPTEPELMEELGVGRSTVREAIRVLAHNGLVEVRQGDGTYVRSLPASSETLVLRLRRARVGEVQEVRRTLELEIARLAAMRHRKADLKRISGHLKERCKALQRQDMAALLDADIAFHCALADATGNEVLSDLYRTFALSLREALTSLWDAAGHDQSGVAALHEKLFKAISARDAEEASTITATLLERHGETLAVATKQR
jgi:GntR family transcriptional regulator, transcriptional repressor for pyruvate dehydrogenase complex